MSSKTEFKILVVDDDESMLDLMVLRFNKMGLKVERANDGRMAQKSIEGTTFDLIVTDIYMPGGTGLSLLRMAKEQDPHTQVIVVTAGATLENAIEALNNGAFAYLTKPFDHISVFDNVVSRALEFRRLVLDNKRMAEIQRRRGDMLEDEVTERLQQLRERQRELLDLLGTLPDGVVVVDEGGRVVLSSPVAEKWLTRELRMAGQPIQRFIETVHDEWSEDDIEVDLGEHTLRLTAVDLPTEGEEKKRKVVVIHEVEEIPAGISPQLSDPLDQVKQGLAWLYQQKMGTAILDVLKQLAVQISEMERLSGLVGGEDGRSDQAETVERAVSPSQAPVVEEVETPIEAPVVDKVDTPIEEPVVDTVETPIEAPLMDEVDTPIEAQVADPSEMPSEPPIDIAERLPSLPPEPEEQVVEERVMEEAPPPENKFQSGLLQKHLDTKPKEENAELEQVVEEVLADKSSASESDEALETLQEIIDGEISAEGTEDQLAVEEDFFENLEKELSFDSGDDASDLVDTPSKEPVPSPPQERSKTESGSWPPQRPSEMNDFEEYK
jgi:DNA-binding response OmpR family regulator